ncbi:precorrin-3B synthase [Ancylothrix sp. C2]|uniref:precorrin-3B synthase n=1 Tax=Ancylothrix sp. D3o TaxID=2953691 RepID=UPI0021BA64B8|nr:precorrin-3B synthase [Ancylothrix sp. D3o]MCT7949923.1 precorrin-3B synthase [Ancylothrix sp. D3o]
MEKSDCLVQFSQKMTCPGLFYGTSTFDGILSRIRLAGGMLNAQQAREVANFSEQFADGFIQLTNRANFQFRGVSQNLPEKVFRNLQALKLAAATPKIDHLRNIMASPTAGIDTQQLIDTRPLVNAWDETLSNYPELGELSAKFSVGFDGGESVPVYHHPNDIWFIATGLNQDVYFRLYLNAEKRGNLVNTGILLEPKQCLPFTLALAKTYLELSPEIPKKTGNSKPRLRQIIAHFGREFYLEKAKSLLNFPLTRNFDLPELPPENLGEYRHIGIHPQRQAGLFYLGIVIPIGRLQASQLKKIAELSEIYGSGNLRLTPWQNLLIPDISKQKITQLQREIENLGLSDSPIHPYAGLVACAGSKGCASSATDTTNHALILAEHLQQQNLDIPLKIHFTGCPKSCAKHTPSDITLLGIKHEENQEFYQIYAGYNPESFGKQIYENVSFPQIPKLIERMLKAYQKTRINPQETFSEFTNRHHPDELRKLFQ